MNKSEEQFIKGDLLLKEYLAADRTLLSVDRTFLAYIRTALTLFLAGVSLVKFFDILLLQALGWILIPSGVFTFIFGFERCLKMISLIERLAKKHGYKVDSAESMLTNTVPHPLITASTHLKKIFVKAYRALFLSIGQGEPKT